MSKTKTMNINCPKCKKPFSATVFESVNSDYENNISSRIMSGELFDVECPHCKFVFHLDYDILYHDLRHGAMIWVVHQNMPNYIEKVTEVRSGLKPPYKTMRIVGDMNALKEKVTCLERNRDDRVIELCKVFVTSLLLSERPDFDIRNAFYAAINEKEQFYIYDKDNHEICCELQDKIYDYLKNIYYNSRFAKQFDDNYPIIDFEWAENMFADLMDSVSDDMDSSQQTDNESRNNEPHNIPETSADMSSASEQKENIGKKADKDNSELNNRTKFRDITAESNLLCANNEEQMLAEIEIMEIKGEVPVLIESAYLSSSSDKERVYLRCKFRSLTDHIISALMVDVLCFDVWGNELPTVYDVQILDLSAKRDEVFGLAQKISVPDTNTRSVKIKLKRIRFADGTINECTGNENNVPSEVTLDSFFDSRQLKEQYIREVSDNASIVPREIGKFWMCSCGRINIFSEIKCSLCDAKKQIVFNALDKEYLSERYSTYITEMQIREKKAQLEREECERIEAEKRVQENIKAKEERINSWKKKHPIIDGTGYSVTINGSRFQIPKRCMRCMEPTESTIHNREYNFDMPVCSKCQEEKTQTIWRIRCEVEKSIDAAKLQAKKIIKGAIVWGIVLHSLLYAILYLLTINWKMCSIITIVSLFIWLLIFSNKKISYTLPGYHVLADLKNLDNNGFYSVSTDVYNSNTTFTFTNGAYALLFAETNNIKKYHINAKADYMDSSPHVQVEPAKKLHSYSFGTFFVMAMLIVALTFGLNYINQEYDLTFIEPIRTNIAGRFIEPIRTNIADLFIGNDGNSKSNMVKHPDTAKPTNAPQAMYVYNGQMIVKSDYKGLCGLSVKAGSESNYYVYLDYMYAPSNSYDNRTRNNNAIAPYEDDLAFIVKAGETVEVDVPIGVYKMYYASGDEFYGRKTKFGKDGHYNVADALLDFYSEVEGDYIVYNGHNVTLYTVINGNLEIDTISENLFPD